jgi:tetratricopeptide (TPR) repeat protein
MLLKVVLNLNTILLVAHFSPAWVAGADITPSRNTPWADSMGLAQQVQDVGDLATVEQLRRDALRSAEQTLGPDHKQVAVLLSNLGATLRLEGRYPEAYALSLRALEIAKASGDKRLLAAVLNGLGLALWNEPARAEPVLRRSLALYEQAEGGNPIDIAKIENNLASLYSNEYQHAKALELMTRALPRYEKYLGPEDPTLALALANMFAILSEQHRAEAGEPYLRRAIAIGEKAFPQTAAMAKLQVCVAALELSRGNPQESARILRLAIALQERTLGPAHPEVARSLGYYSVTLRRMHDKAGARQAENRAKAILKGGLPISSDLRAERP